MEETLDTICFIDRVGIHIDRALARSCTAQADGALAECRQSVGESPADRGAAPGGSKADAGCCV